MLSKHDLLYGTALHPYCPESELDFIVPYSLVFLLGNETSFNWDDHVEVVKLCTNIILSDLPQKQV